MKFKARNVHTRVLNGGVVSMVFNADPAVIDDLLSLRSDTNIEITVPGKKKTNQQNKYLWALLGDISTVLNGNRNDDENIYCQILEQTGAKVEYYQCINREDAIDRLRRIFRAVKIVDHRGDTVIVKCFIGTSEMNTAEMNKVIDKALEYAHEVGIETEYWKGLLKDD